MSTATEDPAPPLPEPGAVGEPVQSFNDMVAAALLQLRRGRGELATEDTGGSARPSVFAVVLINDETHRAIPVATFLGESMAGHVGALLEQALAGKKVGFRVRCEVVEVDFAVPAEPSPLVLPT